MSAPKLKTLLKTAHAATGPRDRILGLELRRVVARVIAGATPRLEPAEAMSANFHQERRS